MVRTLFVFILCIYTCPLFAQDSIMDNSADTVPGLHIVTYTGKGPPPVPVSVKPPGKVEPFQFMLNATEVSINFNNEFRIVDTFCIYDYYYPNPALSDTNHRIQLLRTVAPKYDTNYMIGIQLLAHWKPIRDTLFGKLIHEYANKNNPIQMLSTNELKKLNADNGRGAIYDLDMFVPFKNRYDKCKVMAAENEKGNFIELYYFYNDIKNKRIMKIIKSQLGMVRFR